MQHQAEILARAEQLCRARGVRLTVQRKAILQLLLASDKPLSAYDLLARMRNLGKAPAPSIAYRALDFLLEQGLVHKLESLHVYVGCVHPEQPHISPFLICADCGTVNEIEDPTLNQSLLAIGNAAGFQTRRPVIELLGSCAQCVGKQRLL